MGKLLIAFHQSIVYEVLDMSTLENHKKKKLPTLQKLIQQIIPWGIIFQHQLGTKVIAK